MQKSTGNACMMEKNHVIAQPKVVIEDQMHQLKQQNGKVQKIEMYEGGVYLNWFASQEMI